VGTPDMKYAYCFGVELEILKLPPLTEGVAQFTRIIVL
jgi:hypothetical protein